MSDTIKSSPTTISPIDRAGHHTPQRTDVKVAQRYRATYTPDNAKKWMPVFDSMIETRKDQIIETSIVGLKPNTLYAQAQDAIKWLADNLPIGEGEVCNKYAALRPSVSMTRLEEPQGIMIYFKNTTANIIAANHTANNITASHGANINSLNVKFKDEFTEWLATAQPGDIFEKDVILAEEQRKWLMDVLSGLGEGVECDLSGGKVKVMR